MSSNVEGWTNSRYWSFIRSGLRRLWTKYPLKYKVLNAAKRRKPHAKGKQKYEYKCAECSGFFAGKNVSVDHVVPAGSLRDYDDLAGFVARLFCTIEGLQVLCFHCHKNKTNAERGIVTEIAEFKAENAEGQKTKLKKIGISPESNAKKRVEQFTKWWESNNESN